MKKIDVSQALVPLTLQPFTHKSLEFLQRYTREERSFLIKSVIGNNLVNTNYIWYGVDNITTNVISDGLLCSYLPDGNSPANYDYYFIEVVGDNIAGYVNPPMLVPSISYESFDPIQFSDNSLKSVHYTVKYTVTDTTSTSSVTTPDGMIFSTILFSDLTKSNGWVTINRRQQTHITTDGGDWTCELRTKIVNGLYFVRTIITANTASAYPLVWFSLPDYMIPSVSQTKPINIIEGGVYKSGILILTSSGSLQFDANLSFSASESIDLDIIYNQF